MGRLHLLIFFTLAVRTPFLLHFMQLVTFGRTKVFCGLGMCSGIWSNSGFVVMTSLDGEDFLRWLSASLCALQEAGCFKKDTQQVLYPHLRARDNEAVADPPSGHAGVTTGNYWSERPIIHGTCLQCVSVREDFFDPRQDARKSGWCDNLHVRGVPEGQARCHSLLRQKPDVH